MKMIWNQVSRSLFTRLIIIFSITTAIFIILSILNLKLLIEDKVQRPLDTFTTHYAKYIEDSLGNPPSQRIAKEISNSHNIDIRVEGKKSNWATSSSFPSLATLKPHFKKNKTTWITKKRHRVFIITNRGDHSIIITAPKVDQKLFRLYTHIIFLFIPVFVLLLCYLLVKKLISPLEWVKTGAKRIGDGDLKYKIPCSSTHEFKILGNSVNEMGEKIYGMLEAKRELLLAIAHELRSPLTRSKLALEFLDDSKHKDDISNDINEMEKLITELLEAEKLNSKHVSLNLKETDISQFIKKVVNDYFVNQKDKIDIRISPSNINLKFDTKRMRFLIKNIIDNALTHNDFSQGLVEISITQKNTGILFRVKNYGLGVPKNLIPRLTDPFYRVDSSRHRRTGGVGLGLYLCDLIVKAHGGTFEIISDSGKGMVVLVNLANCYND